MLLAFYLYKRRKSTDVKSKDTPTVLRLTGCAEAYNNMDTSVLFAL